MGFLRTTGGTHTTKFEIAALVVDFESKCKSTHGILPILITHIYLLNALFSYKLHVCLLWN